MEIVFGILILVLFSKNLAISIAWITYMILILQLLCILSVIFIEKKEPATTMAWLMVLIFLPIIGFILYLLLGSTAKIKLESRMKRMQKIDSLCTKFALRQSKKIKRAEVEIHDKRLEEYLDIIMHGVNSTNAIYTEGNDVKLFVSAKDKYEELAKDIENAKESINIEYFIIKAKDESGKKLIDLLTKKAKEGIKVKLIYDRFGELKTTKKEFKGLIDAGGEVYVHLPTLSKSIIQGNYRNHRKIVVIDGVIGYTGGINIGDEYLGLNPKISPWRDSAVKIKGPSVQLLQLRFLIDFIYLDRQKKKKKHFRLDDKSVKMYMKEQETYAADMGVQIISSGPDSTHEHIRDHYLKLINDAKEYIYIQTPYFIPDQTTLDCIRLAADSGKDVRVMIPGVPDKKFVWNITNSYVEELLEHGVKVYMYNGFIHSKMINIDGIITSIGTTNLDVRSFRINYEVNSTVYDSKFGDKCKKTFEKDIKSSKELIYSTYKNRKVTRKMIEAVCRFFAPLA